MAETFIVIKAAHRTPQEMESFRWPTTTVEGHHFSSIGDRLLTVWSCFDEYAAAQQLTRLHDGGVAAVAFSTPEEVGAYVTSAIKLIPAAWR